MKLKYKIFFLLLFYTLFLFSSGIWSELKRIAFFQVQNPIIISEVRRLTIQYFLDTYILGFVFFVLPVIIILSYRQYHGKHSL
jgi:hypothetical protein